MEKKDSLPAIEKVGLFEKKAVNEFQGYKDLFIEWILASVIPEHQNNTSYDYAVVAVVKNEKLMPAHNVYVHMIKMFQYICPSCKLNANNFPHNFDLYHKIEAKHLQGKPSVYIGELSMVNPNSTEAVKMIMIHDSRK